MIGKTVRHTKTNRIGIIKIVNPGGDGRILVEFGPDDVEYWLPGDYEIMENKSDFEKIAEEIGKLVTEKNKAYGNSFAEAEQFLKILFPNGIPVESYSDMLCIVRIFDKLKRIATNKDAFGESPYRDMAGYSILGCYKDEQKKNKRLNGE